MINYALMALGLALAAVAQPGPFQAFLISQSLQNGWRKTWPLVFAPVFSDIPVITLVLFVLVKLPESLLKVLQVSGGILLIYLAYEGIKVWRKFDTTAIPSSSARQSIFKAALVNLLNPNPYIAWSLVLGPILIKGWKESPLNGITLIATFYSAMVLFSTGMVMLFAATRNLGSRVNKAAIGVSAIALLLFGIYQLWSGLG